MSLTCKESNSHVREHVMLLKESGVVEWLGIKEA